MLSSAPSSHTVPPSILRSPSLHFTITLALSLAFLKPQFAILILVIIYAASCAGALIIFHQFGSHGYLFIAIFISLDFTLVKIIRSGSSFDFLCSTYCCEGKISC